MAHHCMLKEAHTISYIQQVSHEWIEGDEEELAYAQATKSLRVRITDIQQGPEVLQRFKAAHEPLVKVLLNFENMESHGEPIKLVFCQLNTWTPPKERNYITRTLWWYWYRSRSPTTIKDGSSKIFLCRH